MEQDNNNNNNNNGNTETVTLCQALAQLLHPPRTASAPPVIERAVPLPAEVERGNCEYKYTLAEVSEQQLAHRVSQLLWRLKESVSQETLSSATATFGCDASADNLVSAADQCAGRESAHYHIGVDDDGSPRGLSERELRLSLQTLQEMARRTRCDVSLARVLRGTQGLVAHVTFRRRTSHVTLTQAQVCCVALAGDANSGKSSLIGVLSSQERDNGRGSARLRVIAHNHELTSGRTSSVTHTALHFSAEGTILSNAHSGLGGNNYTPWLGGSEEMARKTKKLVSLVDLAGHERYLKTTLSGLFGRRPDTVCLTVSLAAGVTAMTREHLAVALALNVPIAIAVTKIDLAKDRVKPGAVVSNAAKNESAVSWESVPAVQTILETLRTLLSRQPRAEKETARETMLWPIQDETQLDLFLTEKESVREAAPEKEREKVPVFFLSSVTGEGLPLLQRFFFHVHPLSLSDTETEKAIAESETGSHIRILGAIGRGESWTEDGEDGEDGEDDADFDWEDFAEPEAKNYNKSKKRRKSVSFSSPSVVNEFADFVASPPSPSRDSTNAMNVNSSPSQLQSREDARPAKILIGKVMRGRLAVGDEFMLGPSTQGEFLRVSVTSVRVHNLPVQFAAKGHVATFCLARAPSSIPLSPSFPSPSSSSSSLSSTSVVEATIAKEKTNEKETDNVALSSPSPPSPSQVFASPVRRRRVAGLALLSSHAHSNTLHSPAPAAAWEFLGEVLVVTSSLSPLRVNYQPVLHCGALQQAVRLLSIEKLSSTVTSQENEDCAQELKSEERALCRFRFVHYPEVLCAGDSFILREDRIKAVGKIVRVTVTAKS